MSTQPKPITRYPFTWTPWGKPDEVLEYEPGMYWLSTPSHGGFYLAQEHNAQIPEEWRQASFCGQGERGWYEEDCDWAFVALTFPQHFSAAQVRAAQQTLDLFIMPKLKEAI